MIGLGKKIAAATISAEADDPEGRRDRRHRPAAVERRDRDEVEQVQEEADEGQRAEEVVAGGGVERQRHEAADRAEDRPGEPDARLHGGVLRHLLHADVGAHQRDEDRPAGLHALAAKLDRVPHLVDEQQQHEAEPEPPAEDPRVGGQRDEHRARRGEDLRLRQDDQQELELRTELGQQRSERDDAAADALEEALVLLDRGGGLVLRLVWRSSGSGVRQSGAYSSVPCSIESIVAAKALRAAALTKPLSAAKLDSFTRGRQASTWTFRVGSCESRSPVGLVKQPGNQ